MQYMGSGSFYAQACTEEYAARAACGAGAGKKSFPIPNSEKGSDWEVKKKWYKGFRALLMVAAVTGIVVTSRKSMDYRKGEQSYAQAVQEAGLSSWPQEPHKDLAERPLGQEAVSEAIEALETDPYALVLAEVNLEALRETNGDVTGWIAIPKTDVSYPVVQTENNTYYLNHTWQKTGSSVGAIFLEQYSNPKLSDFNTLIYGHKMRNGSMFGSLSSYEDMNYWKEHPSVYIADDRGVYRYDIFAAYEVGVKEIVYRLDLEEQGLEQEFIRFSLEHSDIDTGIVPDESDRIVTLSTCTGRGHSTRWIVQAVLRGRILQDVE